MLKQILVDCTLLLDYFPFYSIRKILLLYCPVLLCSALLYCNLLDSALLYSAPEYSTLWYSTLLYYTQLYSTLPCSARLCSTLLLLYFPLLLLSSPGLCPCFPLLSPTLLCSTVLYSARPLFYSTLLYSTQLRSTLQAHNTYNAWSNLMMPTPRLILSSIKTIQNIIQRHPKVPQNGSFLVPGSHLGTMVAPGWITLTKLAVWRSPKETHLGTFGRSGRPTNLKNCERIYQEYRSKDTRHKSHDPKPCPTSKSIVLLQ